MPVCVSGMHRSGTSMVAKVLMDAGLDLGPADDLMPAAAENPEGFWENLNFVAINDALLAQLGGAWDLPPPPPADWSAPQFAGLYDAAVQIVTPLTAREPWGWKDPRNCLTVPFWETAAGPLRHVFVVRNPLEVARSLEKRNGFSPALGLSIWRQYTERYLADTRREDRVITHFDAYFDEPERELGRLLAFVDLPHDADTVSRVAGNAFPGLKHHRLTLVDLLDANLAPEIINLYLDLCAEAGYEEGVGDTNSGRSAATWRATDYLPDRPETGVGRFSLWFFTQLRRMRELESAVSLQELARSDLEARIVERDGMVAEREARVADRDARLAERDRLILEREAQIAEREARIAEREVRIAERDRTITRLQDEIGVLRQTVEDQDRQIAAQSEQIATLNQHEGDLREMLGAAQDQLLLYDAEVVGTLGGALARTAPGAPAAIYYRQVLDRVRSLIQEHVPTGSTALVANFGDNEFLRFDGRQVVPFPQGDGGVGADYTAGDGDGTIAQLEALRAGGAGYLVVPSPARAWLARLPALAKHLNRHYPAIVQDPGACTIYALDGEPG